MAQRQARDRLGVRHQVVVCLGGLSKQSPVVGKQTTQQSTNTRPVRIHTIVMPLLHERIRESLQGPTSAQHNHEVMTRGGVRQTFGSALETFGKERRMVVVLVISERFHRVSRRQRCDALQSLQ